VSETGRWERLSSEILVETPYFALRSDRLRLPDGAVKDPYYVIKRPDAAIVFPLTGEGEVVLVRQYRPAIERVELGLPAGLVEDGEEPEKAARRELSEETGYAGGEWESLGAVASSPSRTKPSRSSRYSGCGPRRASHNPAVMYLIHI
jgi:ADP-ribose pyrophosphatase